MPIAYNNTLKYVDKEKGLAWLSSASSNYQQEITKQDLDTATKVIKDVVKTMDSGKKLLEVSKKADEDLGKEGVIYRDGDPEAHEREIGLSRKKVWIINRKHYLCIYGNKDIGTTSTYSTTE